MPWLMCCEQCSDILSVRVEERSCSCGASRSRFVNNVDVGYQGPVKLFCITNRNLSRALESGVDVPFSAIPADHPYIHKVNDLSEDERQLGRRKTAAGLGDAWGRSRVRTRKAMRTGEMGQPKRVKMEWESHPLDYDDVEKWNLRNQRVS